jgi:hypothetical protein
VSVFFCLVAMLTCLFSSTDLTLGRGVSLGFYLPLFVTVGFSLNIDITATVSSLLAFRARLKVKKDFEKALLTVDSRLVDSLMQQGFDLLVAQKAVIATNSTTEEAALTWAIEHVSL